MARQRSKLSGFTLPEMLVTVAVAGILIAAAFALARAQIQSYAGGHESAQMNSSTRLVFEALGKDIRNAGAGTSFYAGVPAAAFGGGMTVADAGDGSSRGVPAIRIANNVNHPAAMPGSDAIALLRTTGNQAILAARVPADPGTGVPYPLLDDPALPPGNGFAPLAACAGADGLVLISDTTRATGEAESMLLPLDGAASIANNALVFDSTYGINPSDPTRTTDRSVSPRGASSGSAVTCVQPVTYWLDRQGRIRVWQSTAAAPGGAAALAGGGFPGTVPINPANDAVFAEGVEDIQFAIQMSTMAPAPLSNPGTWAFTTGNIPGNEEIMAEARVVRTTVLMRTTRHFSDSGGPSRVAQIEDHVLPATRTKGCADPAVCYDPSFKRRTMTFYSELRNMRLFDMLSDQTRIFTDVRSYRE